MFVVLVVTPPIVALKLLAAFSHAMFETCLFDGVVVRRSWECEVCAQYFDSVRQQTMYWMGYTRYSHESFLRREKDSMMVRHGPVPSVKKAAVGGRIRQESEDLSTCEGQN